MVESLRYLDVADVSMVSAVLDSTAAAPPVCHECKGGFYVEKR